MVDNKRKAVVLLSGGLDSATTLAIAKDSGFECYGITFRYGQRHSIEIEKSQAVAKSFEISQHRIIDIDLKQLGGSALTDDSIDVPKNRNGVGSEEQEIPVTYVPARNLVFLSYATAWAEVIGAFEIFIGVNSTDYSGYPDCRGEFISAFENTANLATAAAVEEKGKFSIHTPIINMTKAEIIAKGTKLGIDYSLTHSCYDPVGDKPCGKCDSCKLRLKGFEQAGLVDPCEYAF